MRLVWYDKNNRDYRGITLNYPLFNFLLCENMIIKYLIRKRTWENRNEWQLFLRYMFLLSHVFFMR